MRQRQWKPRSKFRRVLRRSSLVWWTAALVLGATTAVVTSSNIGRATSAARKWGSSRSVWVVRHDVAAGVVIAGRDVTLADRPTGVVPAGALGSSTSPVGRAARVGLVKGEAVLASRVAGRGTVGVAAMLENGRRAIALKNDESLPALHVGDRVDVLATFDVGDDSSGGEAPSFAVAANAEVLAASARTITLGVTSREAPRVAFALARAAVTVVLRP